MSHASVPAPTPSRSTATIQTRLSGRWLWLARGVWLSAAALLIVSFLLSLPLNFAQLEQVCTGSACDLTSLRQEHLPVLATWGLSPPVPAGWRALLPAPARVPHSAASRAHSRLIPPPLKKNSAKSLDPLQKRLSSLKQLEERFPR